MSADRRLPHLPGLDVVGGLVDREAAHADRARRTHDAFGVQPCEQLRDRRVLGADQRVRRQPHLVEEELELVLGADDLHVDLRPRQTRRVRRHDEERRLEVAGLGLLGAADDQNRLGLVHAGDVDLLAGQDPVVAVTAGGGGDPMRVGPRVGFGDGECHGDRAVGEAGDPAPLLLVGAELADDGAIDGGGDDHQQQGAARRGHLLHDHRQLVHACPAAAVLLGQVDPDEAEFARLAPQFGRVLAGARLLQVVLRSVAGRHGRHGLAQLLLFVGLGEAHHSPWLTSGASTSARTKPTSTCWPAATLSSASRPPVGATMVCSIFMASSQISG